MKCMDGTPTGSAGSRRIGALRLHCAKHVDYVFCPRRQQQRGGSSQSTSGSLFSIFNMFLVVGFAAALVHYVHYLSVDYTYVALRAVLLHLPFTLITLACMIAVTRVPRSATILRMPTCLRRMHARQACPVRSNNSVWSSASP